MGWSFFGSKPTPKAKVDPGMYREPVSQVHLSGTAVIQDNGVLRRTMAASNGWFLFSEVGAGTKGMALIGSKTEINVWLDRYKNSGIENRIGDLPEIYISVQPYRPGSRFVGLFPVSDAINSIVQGLAAFAPGSELTDVVSGVCDIKGAMEFSRGGLNITHKSEVPKLDYSGILYVRFSYLPGKEMHQIGSRRVAFPDIKALLATMIR